MTGSHGLAAGQVVRVSALGSDSGLSGEARIVAVSASDAAVWSSRPMALDSALRIDAGDAMLLGEVISCRQGDGGYSINIHLSQIIPSLSDLGKLVSAVMCDSPRRAADTPRAQAKAAGQFRR